MIEVLEILTCLWGSACAIYVLRTLSKGSRKSILFVYLVFFGLFIIPVAADLIYGMPSYSAEPGFYNSTRDPQIRVLYCLFVSSIPFFWLRKSSLQRNAKQPKRLRLGTGTMSALFIGTALPLLVLPFAPLPKMYLDYGFIVSKEVPLDVFWFHGFLGAITVLSILSGTAFLACAQNLRRASWLISPLVAAAIFLNGKRAIFALTVISLLLVLWFRGLLKGKRLLGAMCAAALLIAGFSSAYQSAIRDISAQSTSPEYAYKNSRIDYGRDSRVKMAMYAELHPAQIQILEYRGESFLFHLTFWIPRTIWPNKPYPYAVYFTSAMLGMNVSLLGWGMTTCILDEAIANFSWFGVFFGPLIVLGVCKLGDSCNDQRTSILTVVIGSLLLSLHLTAFLPILFGWLFLVIRGRLKRKRSGGIRFCLEERLLSDGTSTWVLSRIGRA